jgi:excisionase family DNA binding protein
MTAHFLTTKQVAAELGVSQAWVRAACKRGDLHGIKNARLVRISRESLDRWISANSTTTRT